MCVFMLSNSRLKCFLFYPSVPSGSMPFYNVWVYGVATRLQRNCSEQIFLPERTTEYKGYLVNQGYPSKLVDDQFRKASTIPRSDLLRTRARSKKKLFPFVTTFNPNLPDVGRIISKHLAILESNPKLKELFPPNSIIWSFRRSKNLKELLAPSRYGPNTERDFSFQCIDQVQETVNNSCSIEKLLITKEAYWSAQLFSLAPFGLNRRQEFHSKKWINYNLSYYVIPCAPIGPQELKAGLWASAILPTRVVM